MSRGERKAMIAPGRPGLSLSHQCRLLSIGRSAFYYTPKGESSENMALMRRIDELFLKYPFYGSRQMIRQLRREGVSVAQCTSPSPGRTTIMAPAKPSATALQRRQPTRSPSIGTDSAVTRSGPTMLAAHARPRE